MQFSSIWTTDRTLSGDTTKVLSGSESNDNEGELCFSQAPAWRDAHHQIVECHIPYTRLGRVLPLCIEAVCIFYRPNWLGNDKSSFSHVD